MEPDDQTEQDLIEAEGLSRQSTESQAFLKQLDEKTRFTLYELMAVQFGGGCVGAILALVVIGTDTLAWLVRYLHGKPEPLFLVGWDTIIFALPLFIVGLWFGGWLGKRLAERFSGKVNSQWMGMQQAWQREAERKGGFRGWTAVNIVSLIVLFFALNSFVAVDDSGISYARFGKLKPVTYTWQDVSSVWEGELTGGIRAFRVEFSDGQVWRSNELVSMRHWEQARDAFDFVVARTKPAP